jgi:hypothetical protein
MGFAAGPDLHFFFPDKKETKNQGPFQKSAIRKSSFVLQAT